MPTAQEIDLGHWLIERRLTTPAQLQECLSIQRQLAQPAHLGSILVKKGYVSEQVAREALAFVRQKQESNGSHSGHSSRELVTTQAPPSAGSESDRQLRQIILERRLLNPTVVAQAVELLSQYHNAGHRQVTLGQVLVQRGILEESQVRSLLTQLSAVSLDGSSHIQSGVHPSHGSNYQSGPYPSTAYQNGSPASSSGFVVQPVNSPYGSSPPPSGPHAAPGVYQSGPFVAPSAGAQYQSGPMPAPPPAGMQNNASAGYYGSAQASGNAPVPVLGVESQTMDPGIGRTTAPANFNSAGFPSGPSTGFEPVIETCISPDDPIAQKMRTVKKPDGSYEIIFGPYDILGEVARGGMGIVYRARQRDLKRIVALKVMKDGENASEKQIRRFRRETEAAAKLQHPNIVAVHEVGCIEGFHFFTMDLIEGDPLDIRIKRGDRPALRDSVNIVKEVSQAIHYAHGKKIVHRDLKPANILMDLDGHPKVTDFGLAKNVDHKSMLTRTGAVVGTPYYMPPEQARGDTDIDARCDVYALGVILYELLTGKLPFKGETTMEVYHKILEEDPLSPRVHNPAIERDLEVICLKAMDKERERRYQTAKDLAEDLQRYIDGEPIKARPLGVVGRLYRKARKNRGAVTLGLIGVSVLLSCGGALLYQWNETRKRNFYGAACQEWNQYTAELDNQLISARSLISGAASKNKDNKSSRALQELEAARRALSLLPKLINEFAKTNSRARVGLYLLCLDGNLRSHLFTDGKPRSDADIPAFLEAARQAIEKDELLTVEKPNADDPFGNLDESVYLAIEERDVQDYLEFVGTGMIDLQPREEDVRSFKVDAPLPTRDIRHFFRDIFAERGNAYRQRGDDVGFQRALQQYREALDFDSQSPEARGIELQIARVLADSGKLDESLNQLKGLIARHEKFSEAYLERGHILLRLNRFKDAIADYSHVIAAELEPIQAFLARGRAYMQVGQYQLARRDFEKVVDVKDDSFEGYLERGRAFLALGRFAEAEQDLIVAVELNASVPDAYATRAQLFYKQRKIDDAIKDYDVALVRGPRDVDSLLGLAEIREFKLEDEEALRKFSEVLQIDGPAAEPARRRARIGMARLLALRAEAQHASGGRQASDPLWTQALDELGKALESDPNNAEALRERGLILLARDKKTEALVELKKAWESEQAWNNLVESFRSNDIVAEDGFGSVGVGAHEERQRVQSNLVALIGILEFELNKDKAKAEACFKESKKLAATAATWLIGVAMLSGQSEDFVASVKALEEEVNTIGEAYQEALRSLTQASETRKPEHFDRAQAAFSRVLRNNPWHSLAWYHNARRARETEKDWAGALRFVERAINCNPFLQPAWSFRGFLYARDLPNTSKSEGRDYQKAERDFSRAIELGKKPFEIAHGYFGRALGRFNDKIENKSELDNEAAEACLRDLDAAIKEVQGVKEDTATELRDKTSYYILRSKLQTLVGRTELARADEEDIEKLGRKAKDTALEHEGNGRREQDARHYDRAIQLFTKAIEFDPDRSEAFYNRGLCYLKIGNFIPGILDFSRALELDARLADQFYNKVYQVNYVVDLKRVMDELNKIVEERPNVSYVVFLRGFFYVAKSEFKDFEPADLDRGIKDFDRCLELNPDHITARTYRGLLFHKKDEFERAHKDYDEAIALDPSSGITYYLKALTCAAQSGAAQGDARIELQNSSVTNLKRAFENQFRGYDRISKDKGFENLKDYPPFEALLKEYKP